MIAGYKAKKPLLSAEDAKIYENAEKLLSSTDMSYAESVQKPLSSYVNAYLDYCSVFGHEPMVDKKISTRVLAGYAIWLAAGGVSSVKQYISMGPRVMVESEGGVFQPISQRPRLKRVLRSLQKVYKHKIKRKIPITIDMLKKLRTAISMRPETLANFTLWAQITTAFFTFIRKANYTSQRKTSFNPDEDLTIGRLLKEKKRLALNLAKTKTVQCGERDVKIYLPKFTDPEYWMLCPTTAILLMLEKRESVSADDLLFATEDGYAVTRTWFDKEFKKLCEEAGIESVNLTPHSLRRGGATFALECGTPPVCIKLQGDWASDAWMIYAIITYKLKTKTVKAFEKALRSDN